MIRNAQYNAAGQMTSREVVEGWYPQVETRQYNVRNQLTRIAAPGRIDIEYRYSATANEGPRQGTAMIAGPSPSAVAIIPAAAMRQSDETAQFQFT